MSGSNTLFRAVEPVLRPRCSRIPHLQAHIHSRRTYSRPTPSHELRRKHAPRLRNTYDPSRCQSTLSTFESPILLSTNDGKDSIEDEPLRDDPYEARQEPAAATEKRRNDLTIEQVIEEGQQDRILHTLLDPSLGLRFIEQADDAAFSHAFCSLDPNHFVEPLKSIYRHMKTSLQIRPRFRLIRSMEERLESLAQALDRIVQTRRKSGYKLQLEVYEHMLRWAEVMGDGRLADDIFNRMMQQDAVKPSLACYNSHIGAIITAGRLEVQQKFLDRMTPFNQSLRNQLSKGDRLPPSIFQPPLANVRPYRHSPADLRKAALQSFKALTENGMSGDEHTFSNLMLAMGQNGDISGVKSILRSVWNVNVDLLAEYDEEEVESPTFYDEGHPLRPSGRLLWTIAHVFGNNNQMHVASSMVDYVSRNYNLTVPREVWMQLYESTFILSRPYNNRVRDRSSGLAVGQLDVCALQRLFDIMTDEPHNIEPSVEMLIMQATIQRQRRAIDPTLDLIRDSMAILETQVTELSKLYDEMRANIGDWLSDQELRLPATFYKVKQEYLLQYFKTEASLQLISVAIRNVFQGREWAGSGRQVEWHIRRLPKLIEEFQTYLPDKIDYDTATGHVLLENGYVHRWYAIHNANDHFHSKAGRLAQALDTENYSKLLNNVQKAYNSPDHYTYCPLCRNGSHDVQDCPEKDLILAGFKDHHKAEQIGAFAAASEARSRTKSSQWSPKKVEDAPFSRESFAKYYEDANLDDSAQFTSKTTWPIRSDGQGPSGVPGKGDDQVNHLAQGAFDVKDGVYKGSGPSRTNRKLDKSDESGGNRRQ